MFNLAHAHRRPHVFGVAERSSKMVVLIGVFRLTKAAVLIAVGLGALFGVKWPVIAALASAADKSGFFWARSLIERAIQRIFSLDAHHMHEIGIASLAYAAVFIVEGTGLVLRKRWAEWLTIAVTSSFVPYEAYELVHKPGVGKAVALVVNVAIVVYLIVRVRQKQQGSPGVEGLAKKALRSLSI
jgi:uncharacterized membrane protein (DUF2068 family)